MTPYTTDFFFDVKARGVNITTLGFRYGKARLLAGTPGSLFQIAAFAALSGNELHGMCSSSMDFPEEYTIDPNVLATVRCFNRGGKL